METRKSKREKSPINEVCEGCDQPAHGYDLDGVPLCKTCGILLEARDQANGRNEAYGE